MKAFLKRQIFIPARALACEDVANLAQYNIDKVLEIADKIRQTERPV